jgi:hypothetical protein
LRGVNVRLTVQPPRCFDRDARAGDGPALGLESARDQITGVEKRGKRGARLFGGRDGSGDFVNEEDDTNDCADEGSRCLMGKSSGSALTSGGVCSYGASVDTGEREERTKIREKMSVLVGRRVRTLCV